MRRLFRLTVLTALAACLLTNSASADMGPKPLLTVKVENAPGELYYLDLLAEGLILLRFRLGTKRNWKILLPVNLLTQGVLSAVLTFQTLRHGAALWNLIPFFLMEVLLALGEGAVYARTLTSSSRRRSFAYGLTANAVSALLGFALVEPIWRVAVSIS